MQVPLAAFRHAGVRGAGHYQQRSCGHQLCPGPHLRRPWALGARPSQRGVPPTLVVLLASSPSPCPPPRLLSDTSLRPELGTNIGRQGGWAQEGDTPQPLPLSCGVSLACACGKDRKCSKGGQACGQQRSCPLGAWAGWPPGGGRDSRDQGRKGSLWGPEGAGPGREGEGAEGSEGLPVGNTKGQLQPRLLLPHVPIPPPGPRWAERAPRTRDQGQEVQPGGLDPRGLESRGRLKCQGHSQSSLQPLQGTEVSPRWPRRASGLQSSPGSGHPTAFMPGEPAPDAPRRGLQLEAGGHPQGLQCRGAGGRAGGGRGTWGGPYLAPPTAV